MPFAQTQTVAVLLMPPLSVTLYRATAGLLAATHSKLTVRAPDPDFVGSWTELKENRLIKSLLVGEAAAAADGGSCSPAAPLPSAVLPPLLVRLPILLRTFFIGHMLANGEIKLVCSLQTRTRRAFGEK